MADSAISGLAPAGVLVDADQFEINHAGASQRNTIRGIGKYIGDALHNEQFATPAQSLPASATTYMTGSAVTVPTGERVAVNTWFRWNFHWTKTAAGTVANSVLVKWGTAGTTADATIATLTLPIGTAIADDAEVEVVVGFRTIGAGTAAVVVARIRLIHNLSATGWATVPCVIPPVVVSAGFNSDVDLSKIGLAAVIGASYVVTCPMMRVEAKNL